MSISYHTNWMGTVSIEWFRKRGLTKKVSEVLKEGRIVYPEGLGPGDTWEYDKIATYYSCGRIDILGLDEEEHYNGSHEYSLPVMHGEDWNALGDWFMRLKTEEQWSYEKLISTFEEEVLGRNIRWWKEES